MKQARFQIIKEGSQPSPISPIDCPKPIIQVMGRQAMCDGNGTHPRIYLNLDAGQNVCGYCGTIFQKATK